MIKIERKLVEGIKIDKKRLKVKDRRKMMEGKKIEGKEIAEEEVWPDWIHPMLFAELSCVCMPNFRTVALFFFASESTIFGFFFKYGRGCSHIDILMLFPW